MHVYAVVEILCKSAWIRGGPYIQFMMLQHRHTGHKSVMKLGRVAGKDSIGRPNYAVMCLTPMLTN